MNELAKLAIDAHGGLDRWKRFTTLSVRGINGGVLWGLGDHPKPANEDHLKTGQRS